MLGVVAACTPQPGTPVYPGGTYDLHLSLPAQHASGTFFVMGVGLCTATVDTPEIVLAGATLTIDDATVDQGDESVTIPNARVAIPRSVVPIGTVSLDCFGSPVTTLTVAVDIEATASVQVAVLRPLERTITLTQPRLSIPNASLIVSGTGSPLPPIALPPIDVTVPTISTGF